MAVIKRTLAAPRVLAVLSAITIVVVGQAAIAQTPEEMIATAEKACIDAAVAKGYNEQLSQVVEAESIDANTVEVVLNVTKDGQGFARLTCPYSVKEGVAAFDDAAAIFENAADAVTETTDTVTEAAGETVTSATEAITEAADGVTTNTRFPWWWLLLPIIGFPLLLWLVKGREATALTGRYTDGYVNTYGQPLNIYDSPNQTAHVIGTLSDSTHVLLTGRRDGDWVELREGGWVDLNSLRFTEETTRRFA